MNVFEALVLGAAQGITEFLPVSSSGHLVLLQRIFGVAEEGLLFDTLAHCGTLFAVFVVLWKDIWGLLRKPFQPLTGYLVLGTLPAVAAALLFKDNIEGAFASGNFLGFAFLITAALLAASRYIPARLGKTRENPEEKDGPPREMRWYDALVIGIFQAAAITPGVSRSGATLSGALLRGLDRDFSARFSFLLSIPAILGAFVLQVKDLAEGTSGGGIGAAALAAGTISAAIVGFFSIRLMLKIVREKSLIGFSIYTAFLGIFVLIDRFCTHWYF